MKLPNDFEFYLNKGIIRNISPDKSRAEFLIKEADISFEGLYERVKVMGINNKNSNSIIKDCYDIIMEMDQEDLFGILLIKNINYC